MKISRLGEAPDYRFSLANERTFWRGSAPRWAFLPPGSASISWRRISPRR
jgi:hypothetical protein